MKNVNKQFQPNTKAAQMPRKGTKEAGTEGGQMVQLPTAVVDAAWFTIGVSRVPEASHPRHKV